MIKNDIEYKIAKDLISLLYDIEHYIRECGIRFDLLDDVNKQVNEIHTQISAESLRYIKETR